MTAPSSGVEAAMQPRLEVALDVLRSRGHQPVVGQCMDGAGVVSASPQARAAELQAMLLDPAIRAVVPPWGGELAVEILPHLDLDAIAAAEPTWVVGYSDISTVLLPLTVVAGVVTLHGQNLLDTPYEVPVPQLSWLDVCSAAPGSVIDQGAAPLHRGPEFVDSVAHPDVSTYTLDQRGGWRLLDPSAGPVRVGGTLIGGCIETVSILAGTPYGDVATWASQVAPGGTIVYVEAAGDGAVDVARHLWRMRLAGWFDSANAVLVGRTDAPGERGFSQDDAVRSALGDLDIPIVLDVDCGHVPPHMALLNGLQADLIVADGDQRIVQRIPS